MGLIFGSTDLQTTYGFYIAQDGVDLQSPEVKDNDLTVPGVDGVRHVNPELGAREITVRGFVLKDTPANAQTALVGLENELLGTLSTGTDTTNWISPTRALKDLTLPTFGSTKFQNCKCVSWRVIKWWGPRLASSTVEVEIRFKQTRPFTAAVA